MARCDHGFEPPGLGAPNGVLCPVGCHRDVTKPKSPHAVREPVNLVGITIAGVKVLSQAPSNSYGTCWNCRLECDCVVVVPAYWLRRRQRIGGGIRCPQHGSALKWKGGSRV